MGRLSTRGLANLERRVGYLSFVSHRNVLISTFRCRPPRLPSGEPLSRRIQESFKDSPQLIILLGFRHWHWLWPCPYRPRTSEPMPKQRGVLQQQQLRKSY